MTKDSRKSSRFAIPVSEMLAVAVILSGLWAFLFPAVEMAREAKGGPPFFPLLKPLYEYHRWLFLFGCPAAAAAVTGLIILVVRSLLPQSARNCFSWKSLKKAASPRPEPILDNRPAIVTSAIASLATAILLFTAAHVRDDRTNRRPIVTWEGPIAEYVQYAAFLGWFLSGIAIVMGGYTLNKYRGKLNSLAAVGMGLGFLNCFGSFVFYCGIHED